jgi:hypothetical protein
VLWAPESESNEESDLLWAPEPESKGESISLDLVLTVSPPQTSQDLLSTEPLPALRPLGPGVGLIWFAHLQVAPAHYPSVGDSQPHRSDRW